MVGHNSYFTCVWESVVKKDLFLFCPLYMFIHFSASFCTAHCALHLARVHEP